MDNKVRYGTTRDNNAKTQGRVHSLFCVYILLLIINKTHIQSDNATENAATPVKLTKAEGQKLAQIKLRTGPGVPHDIRLKGKIANKKSIVHRLKKENEKVSSI